MANYATLKSSVNNIITTNGNNEITGALLNSLLMSIIDALGAGYQYMGIATPTTNPGTPDQRILYLARTAGTYANFNGIVLQDNEVAILRYDSAWHKDTSGLATAQALNTLTSLSFPFFTGADNTFGVNEKVYPIKAGHKYRLTPFVKEWEHSQVTSTANKLGIGYVQPGSTNVYSVTVATWDALQESYEIEMPATLAEGSFLAIGGRANSGVRVYFIFEDLTDLESLKETISFIGNNNSYARSAKNTIPLKAGHVYRFTPTVQEWAHDNVTGTTANGTAIGYFANNVETILYGSVVGAWTFPEYYDIKIPDNVTGAVARVGGRANLGTVVEFSIEDVTDIAEITSEIFAPIAEKDGTLATNNNFAYVECNLKAGKEYVMYREFAASIMNLNAGSASSSGLRIWLSNQATQGGTTIQTIEQIFYQNGAPFQRKVKFTASANARYLCFFVNAKAANAGVTYRFGVGKEVGQSVLDLNNAVQNLQEDVEIGRTGTIVTDGVSTNALTYFKPLAGYRYLFTFDNFTKSLLSNALKVQIGYYPDADNKVDSSFVVLRQINNTTTEDVDVSQFKDLVYTFPEGCAGRIVLRGDAGQEVNYRIEMVEYQPRELYGVTRQYEGRKIEPYGHKNNYVEAILTVNGIGTYNGLSLQGFAIYGKYAFLTYDTGYIQILDLDTLTIVAAYAMPTGVQGPNNHAGMANFGYEFYSAADDFPLLYVSSYLENKCYVLRVTLTGCSLIQTITMANAWHFLVDDSGRLIVHMNDWTTYYIFNVPSINTQDVTLQVSDAIDTFQFVTPNLHTTGTFCQGGKMYVLCYYIEIPSGITGRYDRMVVYDYEAKQIISTLIFENSQIRNTEFEGMSVNNDGNIVISFVANRLAVLEF